VMFRLVGEQVCGRFQRERPALFKLPPKVDSGSAFLRRQPIQKEQPFVLNCHWFNLWQCNRYFNLKYMHTRFTFAAMKTLYRLQSVVLAVALFNVSARAANLDTAKIESIIGLKGALNTNEGVFKVTVPRNDVKVTVDGWTMPPFMGLASWAAFTQGKMDDTMVMGDTVLFQDEVNPVMSVALENGLSVTALHNHFFFDEPKVYFMHIGGEGSVENLATAVRKVWEKIKEVRAANPQPGTTFGSALLPAQSSITGKTIEDILRTKGQTTNGMFKVTIGRKAKMMDTEVGKEMGVNTWAAFAGADDNAVVDGDFAVLEDELQPVLKSLRHDGINIVAIHSHMTQETPRTLFLHYWGRGRTDDLAKALKGALSLTKGSNR
jgi:Domain of Unknown Function (DUF1259)